MTQLKRHRKPFRDNAVHVCAEMCETCIFRPGNLMGLRPGRAKELIRAATRDDSAIICHSTLSGDQAVCRGFYDKHPTSPLQVAERLGMVSFQDVNKETK